MTTRLLGERPNEQLPWRRIFSRPGDSSQAPASANSMNAFYSNGGKREARTFALGKAAADGTMIGKSRASRLSLVLLFSTAVLTMVARFAPGSGEKAGLDDR